MPSTTVVTPAPRERTEEPIDTDTHGRDEVAQALLDDTDALLDEIDAALDMEVPQIKSLTLADLIRKGAAMNDQAFGMWTGATGETCALSAAHEAAKAEGLI